MSNNRIAVVQKAKYGVLLIPITWLLFSIWVAINILLPRPTDSSLQVLKTMPSTSEILNLILYAFGTVWVIIMILQKVKNGLVVSAEMKSASVFLLGITVSQINASFLSSTFLSLVGIAIVNIAPIIVLITLLQGKPFGPLTLYHRNVQIEKVSR